MSKKKNERKPKDQYPDTTESGDTYNKEALSGHNHTSTFIATATTQPNTSITVQPDTPATFTATASNGDPQQARGQMIIEGDQTYVAAEQAGETYQTPQPDNPGLEARFERMERQLQGIIQLIDSNHTNQANGQGGGFGDALGQGLQFLNKLIGGDQPTGDGKLMELMVEGFKEQLQDARILNSLMKQGIAKQWGLSLPGPPVQHMIIKQ